MIRSEEIINELPDANNPRLNAFVAMNDPYYGNIKGLDPRKGFLVENDFLNVLGMSEHTEGDGRDVFGIEDGQIRVGGHEIEALNEEMGGKTATIFTTNSAMENLGGEGARLLAESDEVNIINPRPLYSIANHKGTQHYLFDQSPAPVPFYVHSSEYSGFSTEIGGPRVAAEKLVEEFERRLGYDGPVVAKKDNGGRGEDVEFNESPRKLAEKWLSEGEVPNDEVIQIAVDPLYDERIIVGGDCVPITAEERYGDPESDLCNMTQVDPTQSDRVSIDSLGGKIVRCLEEGLAEPVDIEDLDDAKIDLLEDVYDSVMTYVEREFGHSDNYRQNFRGSMDVLAFDPHEQDHLPEDMLDGLMEYVTEDGYGLIPIEWNNQSGSMVDAVNMVYPHQDSAANLAKQMYTISEGGDFKEPSLPSNMCYEDLIPDGNLDEVRERNRYFGLFNKSGLEMSPDELYALSKSSI